MVDLKPKISISDPQRKAARTCIDKMFKAYGAKGGVLELTQKLEQATVNLAEGIFELAQTAARLGKDNPGWVRDYFSLMTKEAETHFKKEHKVDNVAKSLPPWPVYKSEILRAIKLGLSPTKFDTFGAFKAARIEKEKPAPTEERGARPEGNAGSARQQEAGNTAAAMESKLTSKVTPAMSAVWKTCAATITKMDEKTQDAFAQDLSNLLAKYVKKLPKPEPVQEKVPAAAEDAATATGQAMADAQRKAG